MYDRSVAMSVLGSLIQKPSIFLDTKYTITEEDFDERFHKIVFGAISNLFHSGIQLITPVEIDVYLQNYPVQKAIFDDNNGYEYIEKLIKFSKTENFDFNYNILKKYTLLRYAQKEGIDTSDFIDERIVDPKKTEEMIDKFNSLSINDMINQLESRVVKIKDKFYNTSATPEQKAGDNIFELIEQFKQQPEIGLPLNSDILNTICNGARRKKLYLQSCPSGYYKSRVALANCARVSIPYFYNIEKSRWEYTRFCEPSLFITTELEIEEIQPMLLAYVSGVQETHIKHGKYETGEEERVIQAGKYIQQSNMHIIQLPNYSVEEIERTIRKYHILYHITYCYFDYIFTTIEMLSEISQKSRGMRLREDNILLILMEKLKFLCNELDIHLFTSTQVSDGWENSKHPDASLIRACKGLADKCDIAYIGLPPSSEDLSLLEPIMSGKFYQKPNMCYHIYKVRSGSYNKIRLYLYFDGGTCRTTELFATDNDCNLIEISGTTIEKVLDDTTTEIPFEVEVGEDNDQ